MWLVAARIGSGCHSSAKAVSGPWSDPNTWASHHVPVAGEDVTIPTGATVTLDVTTPELHSLTVLGTLAFDETAIALVARWIMVHGILQAGTDAAPFAHHATVTLTANDPNEDVMGMGTRGILVMGSGVLEFHGQVRTPVWTKLAANAPAGATSLVLKDRVTWAGGDQLAIAPTDFYRVGGAEQLAVQSTTSDGVALAAPLQKARWGVLQYIDASGVTLAPFTSVTDKVIDERAEVGNLTRNLMIRGVDDPVSRHNGLGAH